jgi:hypothetical protein
MKAAHTFLNFVGPLPPESAFLLYYSGLEVEIISCKFLSVSH